MAHAQKDQTIESQKSFLYHFTAGSYITLPDKNASAAVIE
jgi:hypothetical protein